MNKCKRIYLLIILVLFVFSYQSVELSAAGSEQTVTIKIFETSDIHGQLYPYDFVEAEAQDLSLAQLYTHISEAQKDRDSETVLLDDGDMLQGTPVTYYYNFEQEKKPHICAEMMNYMKYDAATIGHHDFEMGHNVYDRVRKEYKFPLMAANALDTQTKEPYFTPYTTLERKGVKIAVLGLVTPDIKRLLPDDRYKRIEFADMFETAQKWVKIIDEKEKPDLLIGLFYAGLDGSDVHATQKIAEKVSGFDVVFMGHWHDDINKSVQNASGKKTYIMGPKHGARSLCEATVTMKLNRENKTWSREKVETEIIDGRKLEADKKFLKEFSKQAAEVTKYLNRGLCKFKNSITSRDSIFEDSAFVDISHAVQLEMTKADISFAAPLELDKTIEKGEITVRDIFKLYRYENLLYTMELTGKEIKGWLEYSYGNWFNEMQNEDDHLIRFKLSDDGKPVWESKSYRYATKTAYYNYDSVAGINYTVDVRKPYGQKIEISSMVDGAKFEMDKKYKVAVNSYRANGGGYHLINGCKIDKEDLPKRILYVYVKDMRYAIMNYLREQKKFDPKPDKNWKVVPEDWAKKGRIKDIPYLFDVKPPEKK